MHTPLIHPGRVSKVLIWFIQTMITRMWVGWETRLSRCRQSERGNGNGRTPSGRRTEWNVCHVVFITLTPSLPAWWPFFGTVVACPRGLFPSISLATLHTSAKLFWEIPLTGLFSHCAGMKEFLPRSPLPCHPQHQTFFVSAPPVHAVMLPAHTELPPNVQLMLVKRNAWGTESECRVWNNCACSIHIKIHFAI